MSDFRCIDHASDGVGAWAAFGKVVAFELLRRQVAVLGTCLEHALGALGAGDAWMDAVDRDAVSTQLVGEGFGEMHKRRVARSAT